MKKPTLREQLFDQAYRFDFFQAVRLLQHMASKQPEADDAARPEADDATRRHPVGDDHAPAQEVVRFRAVASHTFPPGSISELRRPKHSGPGADAETPQETSPPEMLTPLLGLTGPAGVLPQHYTSLVIQRVRDKDFALRDFLDLFHHRLLSHFYRAWEKHHFPVAYERVEQTPGAATEDLFTRCLYSLVGLGTAGLRGRMEFDDEAFVFYGGFFAHWPRSAVSLELLMSDYFELPVEVRQFQGQWLYLSPEDRSSLPCPSWPQGLNARLGADVVLGERVWDVQGRFRVRFGPLGYERFCRFSPLGDMLRPMCQMIRSYAGPQFDFDVQPVLRGEEVPWCRLGDQSNPARLGWNTWVRSGPIDHDVSDAIFSMEGSPWTRST